MMRIFRTSFFLGLFSLLAYLDAQAWELRLNSALQPHSPAVQAPKIKIETEGAQLEPKGNSIWDYAPKELSSLLGTTIVSIDDSPADYKSKELKVRLPLGRSRPLQILLYGVRVQDSPKRVREIFATNVADPGFRSEDLFRLYQELTFLSIGRLEELQQSKRPFYVYDAQMFFKYLEVARELGRQKFIGVSDSVTQVQSYLREQNGHEDGRAVITKALGSNGTETMSLLLREIDFVDADQLSQVWDYLKTTPPSFTAEACTIYGAFVKTFENYDEKLVDEWNSTKNYKTVTLAYEALSLCAERVKTAAVSNYESAFNEAAYLQQVAAEASKKVYATDRIMKAVSNIEAATRSFEPNSGGQFSNEKPPPTQNFQTR